MYTTKFFGVYIPCISSFTFSSICVMSFHYMPCIQFLTYMQPPISSQCMILAAMLWIFCWTMLATASTKIQAYHFKMSLGCFVFPPAKPVTSKLVLRTPFAGQNHFFSVKTNFSIFSVTNRNNKEKAQKYKKNIPKGGLPAFRCNS